MIKFLNIKRELLIMLLAIALSNCEKPENLKTEQVTDYDGNTYKTITIGSQVWMAENLKVTHYRNGDPIPAFSEVYDPDLGHLGASALATYGRFYNWYAVADHRKLAPDGWHIPSKQEWQILKNYLGTNSGGTIKEAGTAHWTGPNEGATNESGFTALPGGMYHSGESFLLGIFAYFWTSDEWPGDSGWLTGL
jgi:uncharacterized protein (TIGR02145 family)